MNGWIAPQGDVDELARLVKHVLDDTACADKFRSEARRQVDEEYTMGHMLSSLEKVYFGAVRDRRPVLK